MWNDLQLLTGTGKEEYPVTGEILTASQLRLKSLSLAKALSIRGVCCEDVIIFCCKNTAHFPPLMLATLYLGATCVPINYAYDDNDLQRLLMLFQPKIVFSVPEAAERMEKILPRLDCDPQHFHLGEGAIWEEVLKDDAFEEDFQINNVIDLGSHTSFIMCFSGTTGLPKGVQLSHRNFHAFLKMIRHADSSVNANDLVLIGSPMYWITGVLFQLLSIDLGTKLVILPEFQDELYLDMIQKYKITFLFAGSNSMIALAKCPNKGKYDLSSVRYACCAGTAMSKEMQLYVEGCLKMKLFQWYGMTEILITLGLTHRDKHNPGSVGLLSPYTYCKILNMETGKPVGTGELGELCFKGPAITMGYYKNPAATAATIDKDAWLHTGDVGYCDKDGYYYIVDRIKELIKFRGDHIAPIELEALLLSHPAVKEAVVIGVPHDIDQEHPRAFIVCQSGVSVTEEELVDLVSHKVAPHKRLRAGIWFVDSIPKSSTGKYKRNELRSMCVNNEDNGVLQA